MRTLVIGSGGREHALVWALSRSKEQHEIFCIPGNAGVARTAKCLALNPLDIPALIRFAREYAIDLTVVGGEAPLAAGIVDRFEAAELAIAGPGQIAARLESSKAFAKDFMARHGIPTPQYRVANSGDEAMQFLKSGKFEDGVVVKADGLAAGKGVIIADSSAEAHAAIGKLMHGGLVSREALDRIILERRLRGIEASVLIFADGERYCLMPTARDHKRIFEGDTGPNTGGMGAITTSPDLLSEQLIKDIRRKIIEPTLAGAAAEGFPYKGVLFFGLMLTSEGPNVLEYNVRFGDPEAQSILVRLESDLAEVFASIASGCLDEESVNWKPVSSACVVVAEKGYPGQPQTGSAIRGLDKAEAHQDVIIFHAGTSRNTRGEIVTSGGRVLAVTATGETLDVALDRCYTAIDDIHWDGMYFRKDIGKFNQGAQQRWLNMGR